MATLERTASINANLREASPPKKNPWRRNRPLSVASLAESCRNDPPLLPLPMKPGDSATATTAATPTNTTTASPTRSRRSSSRTSSFSSAGAVNNMSPSSKKAGSSRRARRPLSICSAESTALSQAQSDTGRPPVWIPPSEVDARVQDPQKRLADAFSFVSGDRGLTDLDGLWKHPVGADVHVRTAVKSFYVHRDVVTSQSGWFREHLPPPNSVCLFSPQPLRVISISSFSPVCRKQGLFANAFYYQDGSMVEVSLKCAPETAAYTLRFMYTHREFPY